MTAAPITLYISETCPWAARARIALREAGVKYHEHVIDLKNKPKWYLTDINPAGLVPAVAYGGPEVPPDQPSPESFKLRESYPILEWVADSFPSSGLLPQDPLQRYKARIFVDTLGKVIAAYNGFVFRDTPAETVIKALEALQTDLAADTEYAISNHVTIADAAAAPFLGRLETLLNNDIGVYEQGEGKRIHNLLSNDPKFNRLWSYIQALNQRQSVRDVFPEAKILEFTRQRVESLKQIKA